MPAYVVEFFCAKYFKVARLARCLSNAYRANSTNIAHNANALTDRATSVTSGIRNNLLLLGSPNTRITGTVVVLVDWRR